MDTWFGLTVILILAASGNAFSRINPDTVYQMPPVVVVGKAIVDETVIEKNSTEVIRVSEQQIRDLNAMDLPSALRRVPGVVISRHNRLGSYGGGDGGAIFIRGKGSGRPGAEIQTLVDGVPKFVGVWSHPLMDVLSVDRVEMIDIYKAPQPVLWGNMSFGALNLVSKRMYQEGTKTDFTAIYGPDATYDAVFNHGGKFQKFDYYFGASAKGTNGHRPKADGELKNYWGRFGYRFSDAWDASLIVSGSDNWADDPGPVGGNIPRRARFNTNDWTMNFTVANCSEKTHGFLRLYLDDGSINWQQWSEATGNWLDTNTDYLNRGLRFQQNLLLFKASELTVGFDYDSYGGKAAELHANPANTKLMPTKYFFNTAGYASLSRAFALGSNLTLTPSAGMRLNNHSVFGNEAAPEAGLSLSGKNWNLYSNYSRSFNYMGVYSVWFYNVAWPGQSGKYRNLKPERVKHYEVGCKLSPGDGMSLDLSVYHDKGVNKIRFIAPPPPPPSFANIDRFETTGFEVSLSWSPVRNLSLFTGFTVATRSPETLPYTPGYSFSFGANMRFWKRLQLNLDVESMDKMYVSNPRFADISMMNPDKAPKVGSYTIANVKLSCFLGNLSGASGASHVFLAVENFTNSRYEYKPGYPMPGAAAFLGLNFEH